MAVENNKAVFLDRDGVIIVDKNFNADPEAIEFIPGSIEALKRIPADYLKIIISNQSGIGRGFFSPGQVDKFNRTLIARLKKNGASIDGIYYCPHTPEADCNCRKPKIGLFEEARRQFDIDFGKSWVIGDKQSDIMAGKNISAKTILVLTGYGGGDNEDSDVMADYVVNNLFQAVDKFLK